MNLKQEQNSFAEVPTITVTIEKWVNYTEGTESLTKFLLTTEPWRSCRNYAEIQWSCWESYCWNYAEVEEKLLEICEKIIQDHFGTPGN